MNAKLKQKMYQPLEQFVAWKVVFLERTWCYLSYVSVLAVGKYLLVVCVALGLLSVVGMLGQLRGAWTWVQVSTYSWLQDEFTNVAGSSLSLFIPVFAGLFVYIYMFNLLGLLPYTACWTTQFFANLSISFILIVGITLLNLDKNGMRYFELFIPSGVPQVLKPALFALEFLSYWIRILSLSIRLFSNMVAGHSLLHILFDMSLNVKSAIETTFEILIVISVVAMVVIYVIFVFEFIVAFLQAYVFCVMFSIYLNDLKLTH